MQTFSDMLGRSHDQALVDLELRVYTGTDTDWTSEMGLGCGFQRGLGLPRHGSVRIHLTTSAMGLWRAASSDHAARLWDLTSGETVRQYDGHHRAAVCCALNDINLA